MQGGNCVVRGPGKLADVHCHHCVTKYRKKRCPDSRRGKGRTDLTSLESSGVWGCANQPERWDPPGQTLWWCGGSKPWRSLPSVSFPCVAPRGKTANSKKVGDDELFLIPLRFQLSLLLRDGDLGLCWVVPGTRNPQQHPRRGRLHSEHTLVWRSCRLNIYSTFAMFILALNC